MTDDPRLRRLFSGTLLYLRDVDALRLIERSAEGAGRRRVRPSVAPLRGLIDELRDQYRAGLAIMDPALALPPAGDLAEWRAQFDDGHYTPAQRRHILTLAAALRALGTFDREIADLEKRQHRGSNADDYSPSEVFDLIETLLIALAPVTLDPRMLEPGLRQSKARIKRRQKRTSKYDVEKERRWMLQELGAQPVTYASARAAAKAIVRREGLAPVEDRHARRVVVQQLVNRVAHLTRRSPKRSSRKP